MSNIRFDCACENSGEDVKSSCKSLVINLGYFPAHVAQSNGEAERLSKERWSRPRVLLFAAELSLLWRKPFLSLNDAETEHVRYESLRKKIQSEVEK